jgi:predicted O-methyltransferase YrrM
MSDRNLAQAIVQRLCLGGTVAGIRFGTVLQLVIHGSTPPIKGEVYINLASPWAVFPSRPPVLPAGETELPAVTPGEQLQVLCSLRDRRITRVELGATVPHLILTLDDGAVFFLCGDAPDAEAWQVGLAFGDPAEHWLVVATPGGGLAMWAPETFIRTVHSTAAVPRLVQEATALAVQMGFHHSSIPEVGRLLQTLAATVGSGVIGEIGSGCGVGAAWIVSAMQPGVSFYTVESNAERTRAVRRLLQPYPGARVIQGDWKSILPFAPFALLFADTKAKESDPELLIDALAVGGMVLLDDLTPEEYWPDARRGKPDPLRSFWLNHERLRATELRVTREHAVILAVRIK